MSPPRPRPRRPDRRPLAAAALIALLAAPVRGQESGRLELDDLFPAGEGPGLISWRADGKALSYLAKEGDEWELRLVDAEAGATTVLLAGITEDGDDGEPGEDGELEEDGKLEENGADPAEQGDGDGPMPEPTATAWADDGRLLVEAGGDLFLRGADGTVRRLTLTEAEEKDAKLSPDGSAVAFVRDADLHLLDLASGEERALTEGGEEGEILHGETDWVYWEELWGRDSTGFWWSPDGSRIAYYRFDDREVGVYPLTDESTPYPEVREQRYPKAGTTNPAVRVGVLGLGGGETTWLATGDERDDYAARVEWSADGERIVIQRLNRDQTRLDLLACDPDGGACEPLWREEHPTWVNLREVELLPDGRFLVPSERDGWNRLWLHGPDGEPIGRLSPDGWVLDHVAGVAEGGGWVDVTGFAEAPMGAAERRVLRLPVPAPGWAGEAPVAPLELATGRGWNDSLPSPASGYWVHTWSDADTPPRRAVRDPGSELVIELPADPAPDVDPAALPAWELFTLPGPEGSRLPAALLRPEGFDPGRRYPVIVYHYGCPSSQVVADRWSGRGRGWWHKLMAQRGYAVLAVDNTASTFFGKEGEDRVHRRFGNAHLPALEATLDHLGELPWGDAERIGIWGWSGGGSNTLAALLHFPGAFAAGVSGAPVTDWRLYDTIWTERYLDRPQENPDGYEASSPLTAAGELADPLLLVHGTADDNVHPQNSLVLADALVEAGIDFEMALYPGQKHGFRGPAREHFFVRMTGFFTRHLGDDTEPAGGDAPHHR